DHPHRREREDDADRRRRDAPHVPRRRERDRRPDDALAVVEALRERALGRSERAPRLDPADDRPEAVGGLDVGERERERAAERAGRDRTDEHEIADAVGLLAPEDPREADLAALDRPADLAPPPDHVALGHDVFDAGPPPERQPPEAERERRAPGAEGE